MKGRKLKNFLIFPKFQMTLIFLNFFVMSINFGLIFYQLASSFKEISAVADTLRIPKYSSFYTLLDHHQSLIWNKMLIACLLIYVFCFIFTIIVSHRVSGPIFNLKKYFIRIAETGIVTPLKFRDRDYYEELPEIINKALTKIKDNKSE